MFYSIRIAGLVVGLFPATLEQRMLAINSNTVYLLSSMTSHFQPAFFTLCYWRYLAASGVLACHSENI
jgi:hypothetical protein